VKQSITTSSIFLGFIFCFVARNGLGGAGEMPRNTVNEYYGKTIDTLWTTKIL